MKIAIIEDESHARKLMTMFLNKHFQNINIVGEAESINEGIELINTKKPDLVLLDIQLADGNSFDILDNITHKKIKIIFITSYSDYAIKAFKYGAVNYLLKPFLETEFVDAITKIKQENLSNSITNLIISLNTLKNKSDFSKISLQTIKGFEIHALSDILYFEAFPDQLIVTCTNNKKIKVQKSLNDYEDILSGNGFERIHKAFLVNFNHVKEYNYNEVGGLIIMNDNYKIPVSRRRKPMLMNLLKNKNVTISEIN